MSLREKIIHVIENQRKNVMLTKEKFLNWDNLGKALITGPLRG